jgi:hypothetical protein
MKNLAPSSFVFFLNKSTCVKGKEKTINLSM